ncbi:acylphosphatase [Pasteurellaceae bacterium 15-036681]|nr:acylphosphatase [Pasteurellaceae bacterium 15-036681]
MISKQFFVYGLVQGVGFRFFTWQTATKIGVKGTVRNCSDGSVEVIAQGSEQQIAKLTEWLQNGPRSARVERVIELDYKGESNFDSFEVKHL